MTPHQLLHPAVIMTGPERARKILFAKASAKFVLCRHKTSHEACGQCSICRRVEEEIHPDVLLCREEGESTIKIELVRQICHEMELSAVEQVGKICIIDECHRMTMAAANAFLKTLEEPVPNRYFWLLTTQIGSLPATIVSRCLRFHMKPQQEYTFEDTGKFVEPFEAWLKSKNPSSILSLVTEKETALEFLQWLQKNIREALLPSSQNKLLGRFSQFELLKWFDEALKVEGRLRSNANYSLMLENLLSQS